jgi:deoxyhypusine synthase
MKKKDLLKQPVQHIDITAFDATPIVTAMSGMSFAARDLSVAADIYDRMLADKKCAVILTIAGSTSAAGCMQIYTEMVKNNMVDAIVATGATIVDMDFFEALGFRHYQGVPMWTTSNCESCILTAFMIPLSMRKSFRSATGPSRRSQMRCRRAPIPPGSSSGKWAVI